MVHMLKYLGMIYADVHNFICITLKNWKKKVLIEERTDKDM